MADTKSDFERDINRLIACGPLKTWSVVVSILGDLLRTPQDRIHGRSLAALTAPLGIADQALRVALHRLRKDGWVDSAREGRESLYWLTGPARAETEAVRPRIYAPDPPAPGPLTLVIAPPETDLPAGALPLTPRVALCDMDNPPAGFLVQPLVGPLPDWARDALIEPRLIADYRRLFNAVDGISHSDRTALERIVLRVLILHQWRRLELRAPMLGQALMPPDWAGARARGAVLSALDQFPCPSLDALAAATRG